MYPWLGQVYLLSATAARPPSGATLREQGASRQGRTGRCGRHGGGGEGRKGVRKDGEEGKDTASFFLNHSQRPCNEK